MSAAVLALISATVAVLQNADKWTPALESLFQAAKKDLTPEEIAQIEAGRDAAVAAEQKRLADLREGRA